jgi:peptidyl-prolyl cis-trans isomerase D
MLQKLRSVATSRIAAIIIFVPLIISFAAWGIADIFRGGGDVSIATVGSEKISAEEYQRDFNNMLKSNRGPNGQPMASDQARKLGLPQKVLDNLIGQHAMNQVMAKLGLTVSDSQVVQTIQSLPGFAGALGTFDHNQFLRVIGDREFTEQQFIELVRQDMTRSQLTAASAAGLALPPTYVMAIIAFLNETRAADYIVVPQSAAGAVPAPTDAQLADYVKKNSAHFSTPEYREVTYGEISPDDIAGQVKVTDAQLKQQYQLRKEDPTSGYFIPEKRDVEQVSLPTLAAAQTMKAKVDSGTSFADAAKAANVSVQSLGTVDQAALGDRGAATFAVPDDGITAPQKNLAGYALLHVTKITPGVNKSFDDVKDDIRKDVLAQLAAGKISDIGNAYTDANSGGMSLADAAKKVGMHVVHIAAVDRNGFAPDGSKTEAASDPDLLAQIFAAEIGEDGDPVNSKSGKTYVIKVNGVIPPKTKSLDAVRAEATAGWTQDQQAQLLKKKADAFAAQATAQNNLDRIASSLGVTVAHSGRLNRADVPGMQNPADLPPELIQKIFSVPGGHAVAGPSTKSDSYIVARVTGVAHLPMAPGTFQFNGATQRLSRDAGEDFAEYLAKAARDTRGVTVNQANAARAMGEGS